MSNDINVSSRRHPSGLWVLFTTEMWERFAFYSMRAILVLYLVSVSTSEWAPGFGWSEADAYKLYGWYTGFVYLSPLLGGWIADRFIGQRCCVIIGAVLMSMGEFCLAATEFIRIGGGVKVMYATDPTALIVFYVGLGLMVLGNGFFKPCISVMVGQLYERGDRRRDVAFTIFYMGINIGAFFSPLLAGTVAEIYGYHFGFIIAGIGMICGLISFIILGKKHLKGIGVAPTKNKGNIKGDAEMTESQRAAHEELIHEQTRPLDKKDYDRIYVIVALSIFVIAFWTVFEQAGSSLNVFAKKNTDRGIPDSVISASPNFVKGYFLDNEQIIAEYKPIITRLEGLELQAKRGKDQVQRETLAERTRRLFSFKREESDADKSMHDIYDNLVLRSSALKDRLGADEDKAAVERLKKSFVERSEDLKNLVGEDKFKELVESIGKVDEYLTLRASGLKGRLSKIEYDEVVDLIEQLRKMEENFGKGYIPKDKKYTFPATWYQSVNAFWIVVFAPIFALIWGFLSRYGLEPSTPTKFAIGMLLASASVFIMIPAAVEAKATGGNAATYWLILCYLLATWGELCLSPIGLSMITKLAPARYASLFMGVWFFASSIAYVLAGQLASIFGAGKGISFFFGEKSGLADFFLLMAIIPMVIGFIALALAPKLKRMMHGVV